MKFNPVWRLRLIAFGIIFLTGLFMARLFYFQIVKGPEYSAQAENTYILSGDETFDRGTIFFTNKDGSPLSAATVKHGFQISINPRQVGNPELLYNQLAAILPLDRESFLYKARRGDTSHQIIASRVDKSTANMVKALNLPGVFTKAENWRFYPGGTLAAHTLGFMAESGGVYAGRYGLERSFDHILRRSETPSFTQFFAQLFLDLGANLVGGNDEGQGDLVLTIEPSVQTFLETKLSQVVTTYQAAAAGGIIMDPKTGALYALAAAPSFNPNERQGDLELLSNPLIEDSYELGSIVKPLTMAAALDAGAVKSTTTYNDLGAVQVGVATIKNFDGKARGVVDMQRVLNESLNTGAVFAMQQLGRDRFRRYFGNFGLGEKTGIELPGETAGLTNNFRSTREVEYATASFGQGFAVSPLAMTRALSALGNGGYLPQPHVVKEIKYATGGRFVPKYPLGRRVLDPDASEEITRMLVRVVDEALRGGTAKMPHYRIAAKTGTAQIANLESGGYYEDRFLHSFFGYFPAYEPKFIVFLYVVYPQGVRYASETLTQPFLDTAKYLISYYELPPDR